MTYYRILHVLDAPWGWTSQSEMLNEALLDSGHGVTALRPSEMPHLFEEHALKSQALIPFLRRSRPHLVIVNDGLHITDADVHVATEANIVVLRVMPDGTVIIKEDIENVQTKKTLGALAVEGKDISTSLGNEMDEGFIKHQELLFRFIPSVNRSYQTSELANFIVQQPCVLIFGRHTQEREQLVNRIRDNLATQGCILDFAYVGDGWEWHSPVCRESALAYASRFAVAALAWADAAPDIAVPLSDGVTTFVLDKIDFSFACTGALTYCDTDPSSITQTLKTAASNAPIGSEWIPTPRRSSLLTSPSLDEQAESLLLSLRKVGLLGSGTTQPAIHVCLCGYYGTGNFGDEAILDHLTQHAEERSGLAVVTAIAANPDEVWRTHGIEAISPTEHGRIARLFSRCSLLTITAGLLFDQGMRWVCGTAAIASHLSATDLPGLATIVALAHANNVPVLFYGTGDGPLELEASRHMVKLAADMGAQFFPRSAHATALVKSCGVANSSLVEASDALFGLDDPGVDCARRWARQHNVDLQHAVIVALRDWPGLSVGWERFVATALDSLAHTGHTIIFVDFEPCDHNTHALVQSCMSQPYVSYGAVHDREEFLSLLSTVWAGFSMRLHCALVLGRFGKPSVGIAYLPKVEALFSQLGIDDLLVPLGFAEHDLHAAVDRLQTNYDHLVLTVQEHTQQERSKLAAATEAFDELLTIRHTITERRWWPSVHSAEENERARIAALEAALVATQAEACKQRTRAQQAEAHVCALQTSRSFRLGHALLKPVAKVRNLFTS